MVVALIANLKENALTWPDMPPDQWDDLDSWETIQSIAIALEKEGHRVTFLEGDKSLYNNLDAVKPEICFNLCRGHFGVTREAQIPAILELLRIPYTGSPLLTLVLATHKPMAKRILIYHGLPTPAFQVFERDDEAVSSRLEFPLCVKPSRKEAGLDISAESIVHDQGQLQIQLRHTFDRYHQPALVEQFIEGRRIVVGVVGNLTTPIARHIPDDGNADRVFQGLHIFPPLEVATAAYPTTGSARNTKAKPAPGTDYHCPALLPENRIEDLKWLAAITFRVMGCLDAASFEFQLDALDNDKPYVLEINPLPGLTPGYSDLCIVANAEGWSYNQLVNYILEKAVERNQIKDRYNASLVIPVAEAPAVA